MDYGPPTTGEGSGINWLLIRCRYAGLCASVLKEFYSQGALQNQSPESIAQLEKELHDWLNSLPPNLRSMTEGQTIEFGGSMSLHERRTKIQVYFQYHEALLAIHTERQSSEPRTPWPENSDQKRTLAVRRMLAASCQLTVTDLYSNPQVIPSLSS